MMVEAGCWNSGSSAKFSIVCAELGYGLKIYDSFEGVGATSAEELAGSYDFSGEYAASEATVRKNVAKYGEVAICTFHKGWLAITLAKNAIKQLGLVSRISTATSLLVPTTRSSALSLRCPTTVRSFHKTSTSLRCVSSSMIP